MTNKAKCELLVITWAGAFFPFLLAVGHVFGCSASVVTLVMVIMLFVLSAIWEHIKEHVEEDTK